MAGPPARGRALGREAEARAALADLEARCGAIAGRAAAAPTHPTVLTVEWIDPVMIGGTWMPELVTLAGGTPLVTEPGQHAPTLTRDQLAELDPEVVLVKPCGFDLPRTREELDTLRSTLPLERWAAARTGRIHLADGNAYFNRPGPRLVESLEILAACTHPDLFPDLAAKHAASFEPLPLT